jgi:hypothetical protein
MMLRNDHFTPGSGAIDFKNAFNFDRGIRWQSGYADRGARMSAFISKDLYHKVGGSIYHFGAVGEARC